MLCYVKGVLDIPSAHAASWGPLFSYGRPVLPTLLVGNELGEMWSVKFPAVTNGIKEKDAYVPANFSEYSTERLSSELAAQISYLQSSLCGNFIASADIDGMLEVWGLSSLGTSKLAPLASSPVTWTRRWRVSCGEGGGIVGVEWIEGSAKKSGFEGFFFSAGAEANDRRTPLYLCVLHGSGALEVYANSGEILFRSKFPVQCTHLCWGRISLVGARSCGEGITDTRSRVPSDIYLFAASRDGDVWVQRAGFDEDPKPLQLSDQAPCTDSIAALSWQPGGWGHWPLLVAVRSGAVILTDPVTLFKEKSSQFPRRHGEQSLHHYILTGLSRCVDAQWHPTGRAAAILGLANTSSNRTASRTLKLGDSRDIPVDKDASEGTLSNRSTNDWVLCIISHDGAVLQYLSLPCSLPRSVKWDGIGKLVAITFKEGVCVVASEICNPGGPALPLGNCSAERFPEVLAGVDKPGGIPSGTFVISDMRESKRETELLFWQVGALEERSLFCKGTHTEGCATDAEEFRVWGAATVRTLEGPVLLAGGWGFCAAAALAGPVDKQNGIAENSTFSMGSPRGGRNSTTRSVTASGESEASVGESAPQPNCRFSIQVFDGLGRDVFSLKCPIEPHHLAIGAQGLVAASGDTLVYFPFELKEKDTGRPASSKHLNKSSVYSDPVILDLNVVVADRKDTSNKPCLYKESFKRSAKPRSLLVSAIAVGKGYILTALKDGELMLFSLPELILERRAYSKYRFCRMLLNCDGTLAAAADAEGSLYIISLQQRGSTTEAESSLFGASLCNPWESVSQFLWAADAAWLLAFLQHSTIILVDLQRALTMQQSAEIPPPCASAVKLGQRSVEGPVMLLDFSCLCARAIVLPLLLPSVHTIQLRQVQQRDQPSAVVLCRAEPLEHLEKLLAVAASTPAVPRNGFGGATACGSSITGSHNEKLREAAEYIKEYDYPFLWKQLAHAALYIGEYSFAERALTKSGDAGQLQLLRLMREVHFSSATFSEQIPHLPFPEIPLPDMKRAPTFAKKAFSNITLPLALAGNVLGAGALLESTKNHLEAASLYLEYGEWGQASAAARVAIAAIENKAKRLSVNSENEPLELQQARELERHALRRQGISLCRQGRWAEAVEVLMQIPPTTELIRALYETDAFEKLSDLQAKLEPTDPLQRVICYYLAIDGCHTQAPAIQRVTLAGAECVGRDVSAQLQPLNTAVPHFRLAPPWSFEGSIRALEDLQAYWLVERTNNTLACIDTAKTLLEELAQNIGPLPQRAAFRRRLYLAVALLEQDRLRVSCRSNPTNQVTTRVGESSPTNSETSLDDSSNYNGYAGESRRTKAWLQAEAWYLFAMFERHMARRSYSLAVCAAARLRCSYRNQIPEEVTLKLLLVAAILAGEGVLVSETLCSLEGQLMGFQKNAQWSYLLGPKNWSSRTLSNIEGISTFLFQRSPPRPKADQLSCSLCGGGLSYWECRCASCGVNFEWCTSTALPLRSKPSESGKLLTFPASSLKTCRTCGRLSQATTLHNCPLCHQPYI